MKIIIWIISITAWAIGMWFAVGYAFWGEINIGWHIIIALCFLGIGFEPNIPVSQPLEPISIPNPQMNDHLDPKE